MKKKLILSLAVGILLSSVSIYIAFRNVPLSDLLDYLATIRYIWILPTFLVIAAAFILRGIRWQLILNASTSVNFQSAYHPLTIGFMINCILPGRIGEAARPLILNRKKGVSFTTGLATVAAERLFDAGFLIIFLALALTMLPMETSLNVSYGHYHLSRETLEILGINLVKLCVVLVAGVFIVAFDKTRGILNRIVIKIPDFLLFFLPPSFRHWVRRVVCERSVKLLNHAAEGLLLFKYPGKMAACTAMTLVIWILTALSYYVMGLGCPGLHLTIFEYAVMMVIICFFIALPSVPGYWGLWEAGGVFALSLFGVSSSSAAGFTLANHAVQLLSVILLGFHSSVSLSVNIRQISHGLPSSSDSAHL